jgi:hypothetical protein
MVEKGSVEFFGGFLDVRCLEGLPNLKVSGRSALVSQF